MINLSYSFLISSLFLSFLVNDKIQATQCDSLPPYLQFDKVSVGAFPSMSINSHRVFYENGTQSKNELGMSSGLFGAMMLVAPQAMMEYPTYDAKQDKYLQFHSNCPTMFHLNVGIATLGDRQPDKKKHSTGKTRQALPVSYAIWHLC